MSFLLDTDICSAHIKQRGGLTHRFVQYGENSVSYGRTHLIEGTLQQIWIS